MRVIIADDEPIIRMDLKEILEKEGYTVAGEAADGFDVVEMCRKEQPDLVIMDVKMPLLDGLTASKIIAEEKLAEAVVLLTAYCDKEFIQEAKEANVSAYFVKPVDERTFLPGLEIAVERNKTMRRLEKECQSVTRRLESRTLVEQAKGVIMSKNGLSEQQAYDYIRNISREKNISMKKVAEIILIRRGNRMQKLIHQLCREYTDLSEEEIQVIEMMAGTLQPLANLEAADIFVDCPCRDKDAIVVAEAKPEEVPSAYRSSVVGMLAKEENEPAVARTFRLGVATKYMKARTQENNYTVQSVEPIKYNSRVIGVLIREKRIAEDEENQEEGKSYEAIETPLNHMINENEWLTESIDEALLLVDYKGRVSFRNLYARELFQNLGYVSDILGQKYKNICLTKWSGTEDSMERLKEVHCGNYYLRVRQIPLMKKEIQFAVIIRDITWNREQEKNLVLKSVAVKELHHRVKNNLQTIASLLRLQARREEHEETRRVLNESISRILSISATHQLLSQSGEVCVSLMEVLENVRRNAVQPFLKSDLKLNLEITGEDMTVDSEIATSVALSVNELLQNCMKYAFCGRESGNVSVHIEKGKVYSRLTVKDDGIGFDTGKIRAGSLGLNIVRTMVQDKLHGSLKIRSNEKGTEVNFDFINETADFISISK